MVKNKRYAQIISSLISLLIKVLENGIDNCFDLFNAILNVIESALKGGSSSSIPPFLLSFADLLPGYSPDRAYMNVCERLQSAGIPLDPIFGESNDLPTIIKSIIDGHTEEEDANGFISGGNKFFTVPIPGLSGPAVFPPGIITINGKKR